MKNDQISTYFSAFQDTEVVGGEDFLVEDFVCCNGTVLVVVPPPKPKTKGGIELPVGSLQIPSVGRVASVPKDDPLCPVSPGDWIVTRHMEGQPVTFSGRGDLRIIQFSGDHQSEILGFFPAEKYDEALQKVTEWLESVESEETEDVDAEGVIVH